MIVWVLVAGAFTLAIIATVLAYVTRRDFRIDLGAPTPEQARVRVDEAGKQPAADAEAKAQEVRNAPLDDKIARAKSIAARGKLRQPD